MNTELFADLPETPSPKLAWLRKHNLTTWYVAGLEEPWTCAKMKDGLPNMKWAFYGNDEDEAIMAACDGFGLTHYSLPQ